MITCKIIHYESIGSPSPDKVLSVSSADSYENMNMVTNRLYFEIPAKVTANSDANFAANTQAKTASIAANDGPKVAKERKNKRRFTIWKAM